MGQGSMTSKVTCSGRLIFADENDVLISGESVGISDSLIFFCKGAG